MKLWPETLRQEAGDDLGIHAVIHQDAAAEETFDGGQFHGFVAG